MNLTDETVGQNIRQFRERLGFTQASVADFLGISREQISYYETSARPVSTDHLQKLADLFGIDAYDLLDPDSFQRQINVALAFRADQFTTEDLTSIAAFKRIVKNYRKMKLRIANGE
ncbi:helix-turn-helix domain-containing protein [Spirosoma pulveris]